VIEGRLDGVHWVHDAIGGRAWDMGIVRYTDDWSAWPRRLVGPFSNGNPYALKFRESLLDDWDGVRQGEHLSIDWDCFASILQDREGISGRVQTFLDHLGEQVPEQTYVVFSPEYSVPGLDEFNALIDELARRFDQPVQWIDSDLAEGKLHPSDVDTRLPTGLWSRVILALRRFGIY